MAETDPYWYAFQTPGGELRINSFPTEQAAMTARRAMAGATSTGGQLSPIVQAATEEEAI